MLLDLCLLSCDLNPLYYDFYPLIRKYWKDIVGIDCILILIAEDVPYTLREERDSIILFPPLPDIPTAFQAQCIRLLYPCILTEYKGIIISDMDMIPLQKNFFVDTIKDLSDDTFCIYRDVISEYKQYPMCYCAGSSETWNSLFKIRIIHDLRERITSWYCKNDYQISSANSEMWAQDQIQLFNYVNNNNTTTKVVKYSDKDTNFERLDRVDIDFISKNKEEIKTQIESGKYSDFHLPRPYSAYKTLLEDILT